MIEINDYKQKDMDQKLLIVDDEAHIRMLIEQRLKNWKMKE